MAQSAALQEAYARARKTDVYETIELNHPTFATPVRIITGWQHPTAEDPLTPMSLPVGTGNADFIPCQVSVTPPGVDDSGPTPAKVTIDAVSDLLRTYLKGAVVSSLPITVIYRAYAVDDLSIPGDVIDGLELWEVDLTGTEATGTLKFKELELQAFPLMTYDSVFYPAIQNG